MHYADPPDFIGPPTREDAEIEAYLEAQAAAEKAAYIRHYGIEAWHAYEAHEAEQAAIADRCKVVAFGDDPITRSACFDGYEMAGLTRPIREACAREGCPLCQGELDAADEAWGRANR